MASLFPCLFSCLSALCLQLLHHGSYLSFTQVLSFHPYTITSPRYSKRHVAAQFRSANDLRGIFKFLEILGSTSYTAPSPFNLDIFTGDYFAVRFVIERPGRYTTQQDTQQINKNSSEHPLSGTSNIDSNKCLIFHLRKTRSIQDSSVATNPQCLQAVHSVWSLYDG